MTDLSQLAKSLTKAQYTALWNLGARGSDWQPAPHDGWRRAGHACASLVRLGLAEHAPIGTRYSDATAYRLNADGLALRAHLKGQSDE